MDEFKKANNKKATAFDYNASRYVSLRAQNRASLAKMLNRYSRRKMKAELRNELGADGVG